MRIAVTGSIATDHLMTFPGRFGEQLLADKLDKVSVSFLVDGLEIRRGGVAANIAFGLGCLGLRPLLVGSVGSDFSDYRAWLEEHGVDTSELRESQTLHTARFVCTTDADLNQIASFYPGAMNEDAYLDLAALAGDVDLVVIGAGNPAAMMRLTEQCRARQIPFANDTSQQLATFDGDQIRDLVAGAAYLFCNDYEASLIEHKTGWSDAELTAQVGVRVTTLGSAGARVDRPGQEASPECVAGAWGLSLERAAQLGNLVAVHALETTGPQEYRLDPPGLISRCALSYGQAAADELAVHLS
jgi:adenosine kinase